MRLLYLACAGINAPLFAICWYRGDAPGCSLALLSAVACMTAAHGVRR